MVLVSSLQKKIYLAPYPKDMLIKASEVKEIETIPFGIRELDYITGINGIPFKKISEIFGPWSIGKSTLGYYLVRSAQQMGCEVLWADTEHSWTNAYPRSLGVSPENVDLIQAECAEEYLDGIEEWIRGKTEKKTGAHHDALVILDSVGHLTPQAELQNTAGERQIGGQARLMASFVRKMKPLISMNNIALVVLNHEYDPIKFGDNSPNARFPQSKPAGGAKLEYAKDLSLKLSETWAKDDDDKLVKLVRGAGEYGAGTKGGRFIKAQIYKNKLAPTQALEAVFALTFGAGINTDWRLVKSVLDAGIITKEGNRYFYKGEQICVGRPKLNAFCKDHADELKEALEHVA